MRSNSPSDGSEGTSDDTRAATTSGDGGGAGRAAALASSSAVTRSKPSGKKRRSSFKRKSRDPRDDTPLISSPPHAHAGVIESDPDSANASYNRAFIDDDVNDMTSPKVGHQTCMCFSA